MIHANHGTSFALLRGRTILKRIATSRKYNMNFGGYVVVWLLLMVLPLLLLCLLEFHGHRFFHIHMMKYYCFRMIPIYKL